MQEITIKPPFNPYSWAIATKKNIRKKKAHAESQSEIQ
jgi:hypothetical protein